jgi:hypothetical protein
MSYPGEDGHLSVDVDKAPYPFNAIITTGVRFNSSCHSLELLHMGKSSGMRTKVTRIALQDFPRAT